MVAYFWDLSCSSAGHHSDRPLFSVIQAPLTPDLRPTLRVPRLIPSLPRRRRHGPRCPRLKGKREPPSLPDRGSRGTLLPSATRLAATRRRRMPALWMRRRRPPSSWDGLPSPLVFVPSRSRRKRRRTRSGSVRQGGSRRSSRSNSSSRRSHSGCSSNCLSPLLIVCLNLYYRRRKNPETRRRIYRLLVLQPRRGSALGRPPRSR